MQNVLRWQGSGYHRERRAEGAHSGRSSVIGVAAAMAAYASSVSRRCQSTGRSAQAEANRGFQSRSESAFRIVNAILDAQKTRAKLRVKVFADTGESCSENSAGFLLFYVLQFSEEENPPE